MGCDRRGPVVLELELPWSGHDARLPAWWHDATLPAWWNEGFPDVHRIGAINYRT